MQEIVDAFRDQNLDINAQDLTLDGRLHRFKADSQDHKKSGWYVGFQNYKQNGGELYYVVVFGDHKRSQPEPWKYISQLDFNAFDKRVNREQLKKAKKAAEEEREKFQRETAKECQEKWNRLSLEGSSSYLEKKQIPHIKDLGVRYDSFDGSLFIPLRDTDDKIWSLEQIQFNGTKRFHAGGRKSHCFHCIGELRGTDRLYFAEGFSTAASIYLATKSPVVCAFDAGNLRKVVSDLRKIFPERQFVICGDDDQHKDTNTGRIAAEATAKEFAAVAIFPKFKSLDGNPTDWNDLHCREGIGAVELQILGANLVVKAEEISRVAVMQDGYPDQDEATGKKLATIENVREMLNRLGIVCRYNVITKDQEILIPGLSTTVDNQMNVSIAHIISWCERVKIPCGKIESYIGAIADENPYNPVLTWIESKPWDGRSRLNDFFNTITAVDEAQGNHIWAMKEILIKTWLISCAAALLEPNGIAAQGMLVLQGPQYLGKTSWFKRLLPASLGVFAEGISLNAADRDSVYQTIRNFIVELGELGATFRKSDLDILKNFITRQTDVLRRSHARNESKYPRRTILCGTVNDEAFLYDKTGTRRFWVIKCAKIAWDHGIDMQQLWAEILALYRAGGAWKLNGDQISNLNEHNEQFIPPDAVEEGIMTRYDWTQKNITPNWKTATQVCEEIGKINPTQSDLRCAGRVLRKLSFNKPRINRGLTQYDIPLKSNRRDF